MKTEEYIILLNREVKGDKITIDRIRQIHPKLREELTSIYLDICRALTGRAVCRFTQVYRSIQQQNDLYAQGRTKPGKIVTWARGGKSYHNYGLAVDIVLLIDSKEISWDMIKDYDGDIESDWMEIVAVFKRYSWEWGGEWRKDKRDNPHFQKTFGFTTTQLMFMNKDKSGYPILL